jgi:hypothetical protein
LFRRIWSFGLCTQLKIPAWSWVGSGTNPPLFRILGHEDSGFRFAVYEVSKILTVTCSVCEKHDLGGIGAISRVKRVRLRTSIVPNKSTRGKHHPGVIEDSQSQNNWFCHIEHEFAGKIFSKNLNYNEIGFRSVFCNWLVSQI